MASTDMYALSHGHVPSKSRTCSGGGLEARFQFPTRTSYILSGTPKPSLLRREQLLRAATPPRCVRLCQSVHSRRRNETFPSPLLVVRRKTRLLWEHPVNEAGGNDRSNLVANPQRIPHLGNESEGLLLSLLRLIDQPPQTWTPGIYTSELRSVATNR